VVKRWGIGRALQLVGFCHMWRLVGSPSADELTGIVRQKFSELGMQKSTAYRYMGHLREWNAELGRDPDQVQALMAEIAAVFDVPQEEETPTSKKLEPVIS